MLTPMEILGYSSGGLLGLFLVGRGIYMKYKHFKAVKLHKILKESPKKTYKQKVLNTIKSVLDGEGNKNYDKYKQVEAWLSPIYNELIDCPEEVFEGITFEYDSKSILHHIGFSYRYNYKQVILRYNGGYGLVYVSQYNSTYHPSIYKVGRLDINPKYILDALYTLKNAYKATYIKNGILNKMLKYQNEYNYYSKHYKVIRDFFSNIPKEFYRDVREFRIKSDCEGLVGIYLDTEKFEGDITFEYKMKGVRPIIETKIEGVFKTQSNVMKYQYELNAYGDKIKTLWDELLTNHPVVFPLE